MTTELRRDSRGSNLEGDFRLISTTGSREKKFPKHIFPSPSYHRKVFWGHSTQEPDGVNCKVASKATAAEKAVDDIVTMCVCDIIGLARSFIYIIFCTDAEV